MNAIDAQDALIARLEAMPGRPHIAYPNGPLTKDLPRIVVQVPTASVRSITVRGRGEGEAQIVARIETSGGDLKTEGSQIAKLILTHFEAVQRFDGLTLIEPPTVQAQYQDDRIYYIPVLIRARFYTSGAA